jgi:hypothetical protein
MWTVLPCSTFRTVPGDTPAIVGRLLLAHPGATPVRADVVGQLCEFRSHLLTTSSTTVRRTGASIGGYTAGTHQGAITRLVRRVGRSEEAPEELLTVPQVRQLLLTNLLLPLLYNR